MQIIKKVSAYIVRFSCGKFVEALDEGKVNTYWPLSEVFCFYKGSTEMMYPSELNCAE